MSASATDSGRIAIPVPGRAADSAIRVPRPPPSFGGALLHGLRRSPPWFLSIAFHFVGGVAFVALTPSAPPRPPERTYVLGEVGEKETPRNEPLPSKAVTADPSLPLLLRGDPEPRIAEGPEEPAREPLPAPSRLADPRPDFTIGFGRDEAPRRKREEAEPVKFTGNPAFGGEDADRANRDAAGLLLKGLGRGAEGERALLRRLDARKVLVVRGSYDHTESLFDLWGLQHEVVDPQDLDGFPLPEEGVIVVDCGNEMLTRVAARRVREYVAGGGYLCTTDWGLENVLERSFPGVLRSLYRGGAGVCTMNEVISIRPLLPDHALLRGLGTAGRDARWWVEDRAHPIEVVDHEAVQVLVESPDLRRKYGSGVVAATFGFGKGRVLHLIGHTWQKEGNLKGVFSMQRVVLNFLLERVRSQSVVPAAPAAAPSPSERGK